MAVHTFVVNPVVLNAFIFYSTLVLAKMVLMSFLTGATRFRKQTFANPEDARGLKNAKIRLDDVDVERVRRCHLNDLENIYLFVLLGLFYSLSGPSVFMALWHFRVFTASRFLHTFVYVFQVRQPARALAFFVGVSVCISMIVQIILKTIA